MVENDFIRNEAARDLQALLAELENLAPKDLGPLEPVILREVEFGELVDDSGTTLAEEEEDSDWEQLQVSEFTHGSAVPMVAVDAGIVRLGETENGLVIALRASIVVQESDDRRLHLFRSGPIYLRNEDRLATLHAIGQHLGSPSFYVRLDTTGAPVELKYGAAEDSHQFGDRFRNWFERLAQRVAVSAVENGLIVFDGALTLRTRDTPGGYLISLANLASERGNTLIGISKQSKLQVGGKPYQFLLDEHLDMACYTSIAQAIRLEAIRAADRSGGEPRVERILGNMYVARFSPMGPSFRMDVRTPPGLSVEQAIANFYTSAQMRAGYPDVLVQAHAYSYFTSPDVIELQAQANTRYRFIPRKEPSLTASFAPFGGRFK